MGRRALFQHVRSVTRNALFRRGPVEKNRFTTDHSRHFVTGFAPHVAMCPLQCESSFLVVIKQRGFPFRAVVTWSARRHPSLCKLRAVDIRMTCLALDGSCLEIRVHQRDR
jgi:hypothetical protein